MKIHGHPQKAEYDDASQFPDLSCQHNWVHGESPREAPVDNPVLDLPGGTFGNGKLGHAHNDLLKYPLYGEITEPFQCRFAIKLFQVTGQAFLNPAFQDGIRNIVWDATGTSTSPDMIGVPDDEVIFGGTLVVDPSIATQFPTVHGWWAPDFNVTTRYTNGDVVDQLLYAPVFVRLDPTAPEKDGLPFASARVSPHSTLHPEENFGNNQVETLRSVAQYLPVAPITAPYAVTFATSGYGADLLPPATSEVRQDADIHRFKPGVVRFDMTDIKNHQFVYAFDPAILGAGKHSIIVGRRQVTLSNDELIVTQLVFAVTVAGTTPPPQTVTVPTVVGLTQAAATSAIVAAGLVLGAVMTGHSATVPAGLVLSQTPPAGTVVPIGGAVALLVSSGPVIVPPPDVETWTPAPMAAETSSKGRMRIVLG